jgi:4-hydroxyphenylpyruvate dioxygenase
MKMPNAREKSIATVSLSGTLPDKLEAAAAAGFDSVEIFEADLLSFNGTPRDVRRMVSDLGIGISIFQPFRDFDGMEPAQLARNLDRAERKFDVMGELGTELILVCSNVQENCNPSPARSAADFALLAARAGKRGIRLAYEALAWGTHVKYWRQAWEIIKMVDHPALGLTLDSFHTLALGDSLTGIEAVPGEKIFFMQLADAPLLTMDVLSWSRHYRNFPGQGDLDVTGFVRQALHAGYQGPLSLEIFNDEFRAGPTRPLAVDGLRSLIWVEAAAGQTELPPPPQLDGFDFLEFAVDAPAAVQLGGFLEKLGFAQAGKHRSKAVTLYRQGEVNLVLNAEPDSAASEHFVQHGASVCAMALKIDQVEATLARAQALLIPTWTERTGPGEHRIPAVRQPDGTLLYLVKSDEAAGIWAQDFEVLPTLPSGDRTLSIDHIAQALTPGSLDRFILFYRSLFGLAAGPTVEFADRFGLIRSRSMQTPDGAVRLALNISESTGTETARFVAEGAGTGVHHIAFATPDVMSATAAAIARGMPELPIPANYYEDLEARFGLAPELLAAFKKLGILYDQDAGGTFHHSYTPNFAGRFFFEFCARNGYQGYGAANAPIRLAAMTRLREGQAS